MITLLVALALVLPGVPGAYNHHVTQQTLNRTVCVPGWSARVRPPESYTSKVKRRLLHGRPAPAFQLDHLVSLSLGGAPYSLKNLWLEPIGQARAADVHEGIWHRQLCAGTLSLRQARKSELAYKRTVG
jgi:hypothetical protein